MGHNLGYDVVEMDACVAMKGTPSSTTDDTDADADAGGSRRKYFLLLKQRKSRRDFFSFF